VAGLVAQTPGSMDEPRYDPHALIAAYERYGDQEWHRHEESPSARASFRVHCELLRRWIRAGDRVLEAGAGAGRFTVELAGIGARVTVVDISDEQLRLHVEHLEELGLSAAVERRERLDILDLGLFEDGAFDAVVCIGGPLSHVLDRTDQAFAELLRVTKPGGLVVASVMSLLGSVRLFLPGLVHELRTLGPRALDVLRTGYLPDEQSSLGPMRLFRWTDVEALVRAHPCELVAASAANFLTTSHTAWLEELIERDPGMWDAILGWEVATAVSPGALDGGTHIAFVVRKS
jgi:SAM-dependent methyltransferase